MNRWLLGIALLLTVWLVYQSQRSVESVVVTAQAEPIELPEPRPFGADEFPPLESFVAMIERPLFNPERILIQDVTENADIVSSRLSSPDSVAGLILSGVTIIGASKAALLLDDDTGQFVRLGEGEELGGWRVQSIEPTRVSLVNDEGEEYHLRLRPEYAHEPSGEDDAIDDKDAEDEADGKPIDLRALLEDEELEENDEE